MRGVRPFGGILPKACLRFLRLSRNSGVHRNLGYRRPAPLEKANAALHCRRHGRLHALTAACFLRRKPKGMPMTKRITILKGSPRENGNTNSLCSVFEERLLENTASVRSFSLHQMRLNPCTACRACQKDWSRIYCVQTDDFAEISRAVADSDLIVLATPIYSWYCTPPMKALLDRMVYAFNMYYGESRGPSLWAEKSVAILSSCGYPPEKGADLFEEGIRRYCKHSKLNYLGMLCEHHTGYKSVFLDDDKIQRARVFAGTLLKSI